MAESADDRTRELLSWLLERPRTYAETMEVWQTACPRHSTWEDACTTGLVRIEGGSTIQEALVVVTDSGMRVLPPRAQ